MFSQKKKEESTHRYFLSLSFFFLKGDLPAKMDIEIANLTAIRRTSEYSETSRQNADGTNAT